MSASGIKAGQAFVEFTLNDAALVRGLNNAQKRIEAFGNGLASVGTRVAGLGLAVAAPLIASAKSFASYGKGLSDVAARTNVSASALSELGYAAKQTGSDLETLESGLRNMQMNLLAAKTGSVAVQKTLKDLGLTIEQLSTLAPEKQFEAIAAAMAKVSDPAKRLKSATEIFGKSAQTLFPLISGGAAAIAAFRREAGQVGAAISEEDVRAAAVLDDAFGKLSTTVNSLYVRVGAALAPALNSVLETITPLVQKAIDWLDANKALVTTVAKAAAIAVVAGAALYALGTAIGIASVAVGGLAAAVGLLGGGALTAAFWIALGGAVLYFGSSFDSLGDVFTWVRERFGTLAQEAGDLATAFTNALTRGDTEAAGKLFWATLDLLWENGKQGILAKTTEMVFGVSELILNAETGFKRFLATIENEYQKTAAGFNELSAALVGDLMAGGNADLKEAYRQGNQAMGDAENNKINNSYANAQAQINRDFAKEINLLDAARAEAAKAAQERLDAARRAYDDAKNAATGPNTPGPDAPPPKPKPPALPGGDQFDANSARSAVAPSTPAIFGGALAGQVFGVGDVQKESLQVQRRMLEKQEKQIEVLRKIEAKSEPLALK